MKMTPHCCVLLTDFARQNFSIRCKFQFYLGRLSLMVTCQDQDVISVHAGRAFGPVSIRSQSIERLIEDV